MGDRKIKKKHFLKVRAFEREQTRGCLNFDYRVFRVT